MAVLGIDLGGTKLAVAVFAETGALISKETIALGSRKGAEVGLLIREQVKKHLQAGEEAAVKSIGVSVPGISYKQTGTVWAPNIAGWEDYPLLEEIKQLSAALPVTIDSDRACYILGEIWQGNAKGSKDAIFLAVGTGIGAGILVNGTILRGAHDIAGSIGWMALDRPYKDKFTSCGCFEYHASGAGIARVARDILNEQQDYKGELRNIPSEKITAQDVFDAFERKDPVALAVIQQGISFWGMAIANLVSIFNPEKIILGGGVFGPGVQFIEAIKKEAAQWAQPISIKQVSLEQSALGGDAGIYGAGFLAVQNIKPA